jgi:hypothetical protein
MTVYVDNVRHRFKRMVMCRLWSDRLDELLAMVDKIGVQRKWIQGHPKLSIGTAKQASSAKSSRPIQRRPENSLCGLDTGILTDC